MGVSWQWRIRSGSHRSHDNVHRPCPNNAAPNPAATDLYIDLYGYINGSSSDCHLNQAAYFDCHANGYTNFNVDQHAICYAYCDADRDIYQNTFSDTYHTAHRNFNGHPYGYAQAGADPGANRDTAYRDNPGEYNRR